jgi:D-alanyl-D-alanine carboxypeptidase
MVQSEVTHNESAKPTYRQFSPEEFKEFYDSFRYPDVTVLLEPPPIAGDREADRRIVGIAESRGYRLRAEGESQAFAIVEGKPLHPDAAAAWQELKAEAKKDGIELGLISGYRSVDRQREIFLRQLAQEAEGAIGREYTAAEIAEGLADDILDRILSSYSIPGYSKHHTGYTLDITDVTSGRDFTEFGQTPGFEWISRDNYRNAKRFGFLPSYPEGATEQGPLPEPWEYVWVGEAQLRYETR